MGRVGVARRKKKKKLRALASGQAEHAYEWPRAGWYGNLVTLVGRLGMNNNSSFLFLVLTFSLIANAGLLEFRVNPPHLSFGCSQSD